MAITTDSYYDIINAGVTLDRIGLSKTLDNYTIDDIKAMTFCGATEDKVRYFGKGIATGSQYTMVNYTNDISGGCPYITRYIGGQYQYPQLAIGGTDKYNYPDGLNHTVLWLYRSSGTYDGVITPTNQSNYMVITEWDAPKYTMYISYDNTKSNIFLIEDNISVVYNTNRGAAGNVQVNAIGVPYIIFEHDGKVFFMHAFYFTLLETTSFTYINNSNNSSCMCAFRSYTDSEEYGTAVTMADLCNGDNLDNPATLPAQVSVVNYYNYTGHTMVDGVGAYVTVGSNTGLGVRGISMRYFYSKIESMLLNIAGAGLYFNVGNTEYKPIISGGWVIDYTDDLGKTSDIDNWSGSTKHNVPPTPPAPPTPDNPWDVDPETYGWSGGEVSGMVKYYLLTSGQMSSLQTAIASNANWTIDYLNCVVSCFVVPNSGIFFDAPIPTTVKFKLDNATEWDTGVGCARIQGTKNKSGGAIEIPRLTNTFYDFEPYSDYSVYIPFCGRVPIKGNVCLGREIKVTYYPDVPTCSLTAVVSCGGATIAIAKGSFGTMTPVTSNGSDRKTAAVIGDVAPIITGIGTGIVGVALGNPLIVGAGAAQALGGIMGGVKETVQSYAYSVGSTGDSSFFGAGNRCYYYANYPLIDDVVNDSMFGHSVGYLCNTVGKLSGFTGFTICANPHVTFSATSEEREEIERLLSMGVIL